MALDMMRESRAKGRDQTIESFHQARRGTHDSESLLQSQILCNMQREGMSPCLASLTQTIALWPLVGLHRPRDGSVSIAVSSFNASLLSW